mgnify:CR=1 FL=1
MSPDSPFVNPIPAVNTEEPISFIGLTPSPLTPHANIAQSARSASLTYSIVEQRARARTVDLGHLTIDTKFAPRVRAASLGSANPFKASIQALEKSCAPSPPAKTPQKQSTEESPDADTIESPARIVNTGFIVANPKALACPLPPSPSPTAESSPAPSEQNEASETASETASEPISLSLLTQSLQSTTLEEEQPVAAEPLADMGEFSVYGGNFYTHIMVVCIASILVLSPLS